MWIRCNPNPLGKTTGDCVVRAIAIATDQSRRLNSSAPQTSASRTRSTC